MPARTPGACVTSHRKDTRQDEQTGRPKPRNSYAKLNLNWQHKDIKRKSIRVETRPPRMSGSSKLNTTAESWRSAAIRYAPCRTIKMTIAFSAFNCRVLVVCCAWQLALRHMLEALKMKEEALVVVESTRIPEDTNDESISCQDSVKLLSGLMDQRLVFKVYSA
ncbi:hypothetical protein G5I_08422 [Acromyrmex echinatior]|uniref:Uncharacterized protein n=1 Tax=Acromyrmex echinatior TaxID=103372 RepID=F4WRI5_ACREC|nr:hypothetical protein G5I_08422 [Acromyrmex echinatior]